MTAPEATRRFLQLYLSHGFPVPSDAAWIVYALKEQLIPVPSTRMVKIGRGVVMLVDLSSFVGREIYYHRSYEPRVARFLRATLACGDIVIDAGANVGELTLRSAKCVGGAGRVIAIEASGETARILRHNVAINGLGNVTVVESALSHEDTTLSFFLGSDVHSLSSSLSKPDDFSGRQVHVRGVCLETVLRESAVDHLRLLKMDIEGAEFDVLRAGAGVLRALPRRPIVVFEFNKGVADRAGWRLSDIQDVLCPLGYELYYLEPRAVGRRFQAHDERAFDSGVKLDLVAQ